MENAYEAGDNEVHQIEDEFDLYVENAGEI